MAAKKGNMGGGDILCPLVVNNSPAFELDPKVVYKVWNEQLTRFAYGSDIIIKDGYVTVNRSFVREECHRWSRKDKNRMWASVVIGYRLDLSDNGVFKMSYFNISPVPNYKWAAVSSTDARDRANKEVEEMDKNFLEYLQDAPILKRLWYLSFPEFTKTTWIYRKLNRWLNS